MHARQARSPATAEQNSGGTPTSRSALDTVRLTHLPKWAQEQPAASLSMQARLTINQPGDRYEQEADRVADQVMRMPEPRVQRKCACGGTAGPDGACAACKHRRMQVQRQVDAEEEELLQTRPLVQRRAIDGTAGSVAPPDVHTGLRSPGQPLDPATRAFMEPRFGYDFSQVRIHTGTKAAESAQAVNAMAYTTGNNIVFGAGQPAQDTTEGRRLLAHELTHVVQQQQGLSPLSSPLNQPTQTHSQLEEQAPTTALRVPAAPLSVTVQAAANPNVIYRQSCMTRDGRCYSRNSNTPNGGWEALCEAARGLRDIFNRVGNVNFRNKASAQYQVTFEDGRIAETGVYAYHSGRQDGSDVLRRYLQNDPAVGGLIRRTNPLSGGTFHTEATMHHYGRELVNLPEVHSIKGFVFTFYTPCSEDCRPIFESYNGPDRQWYVKSHCVAREHGFRAPATPRDPAQPFILNGRPLTPAGGDVRQQNDDGTPNLNYRPARWLKRMAGDRLDDTGPHTWTKYRVLGPDNEDQETPGSDGSIDDIGTPVAIGVGAGVATGVGVAGANRLMYKLALQQAAENLLKNQQEKREKALAELAERKAKQKLAKVGAKATGKVVIKPLQALSAIAFVYLLTSGEAKATVGLSGDDPLVALLQSLSQDDEIPEPLRTMIENDDVLRSIAEEAAQSGDLSAAQSAAAEYAAQLIADNVDQFTPDEIEALLIASSAVESASPLIKPTVEQLKITARAHGMEVGTEASESAVPEGLAPGPAGTSAETSGARGGGVGAPAVLPGASPNVQHLWKAITGTKGILMDEAFAQEFQAQIGNDLSEAELDALMDVLVDIGVEFDPDEFLGKLRARLDELRSMSEAAPETSADTGTGEPREKVGDGAEVVEGPTIESLAPSPTDGLDTESALEQLRAEFAQLSPIEWPSAPGKKQLRRAPFIDTRSIVRGKLFYTNPDHLRCLQYVDIKLVGRESDHNIVEVTATSPLVCQEEERYVTSPSVLQVGAKVALHPILEGQ